MNREKKSRTEQATHHTPHHALHTMQHTIHDKHTTTTTTPLRGPATVSWWRGLVPVRFAPDGEARSRPGVTVAGGPRGLQVQRDESDDGRHSLGSCCPEDLSVRCRLLRESDPRTRGPQSPVQSDTTVFITSVYGGARENQSGFPDGAGVQTGRGGRRCGSSWTRFLTCPCSWWCRMLWRFHSCSSWAVQFFDKVADVPVAAAHSSLSGMIVVCQCHRSRRFSCWVSSCSSGS